MIRIEKPVIYGWNEAIRGMRNPMNSWDKSDSWQCIDREDSSCFGCEHENFMPENGPCQCFKVGDKDLELMKNLRKAGNDHRKFMRMITVYMDITAPLYWFKEFDTYKVGTVANSCSTMHKIHAKEFTLDDFSCEHLDKNDFHGEEALAYLEDMIVILNKSRDRFLETKDKKYWWHMIQLLPSSYNQKRTVMLNYEVLANMYKSRKNHKLDEWIMLCEFIETMPYSELITGKE